MEPESYRKTRYEIAALALPLLLAAHFLWLRLRVAGFPSGDEGSWMAVGAQLARGEGFTTRWLEHHWLTPYALPRPDDFRYPGLTVLLGLAFRLFGTSYTVALTTVAVLFLGFITTAYFALRKPLGFWPAYVAAVLAACSPLQLEWNAGVYTEGLFGLALAFWVSLSLQPEKNRDALKWWAQMGAGVGLLYLVRPNGLLLFAGILGQFAWDRVATRRPWTRLGASVVACGLVVAPWMIRNAVWFGNPLHIAGSAGLLRDQMGQSHNLDAGQYFSQHSLWFPLERMAVGAMHFFQNLQVFEHGLEILPLAGLVLGLMIPRWRRCLAVSPAFAIGFFVSWAACAFASWNSWAGVRYFSSYLPFVYALGVVPVMQRLPGTKTRLAFTVLLALVVANPHRFYERHYRARVSAKPAIAASVRQLESLTPAGGFYYGKALCQLNFLIDRRCVGLQELYDTTWFSRSEPTFHPRLLALRRGEDSAADIQEALNRYRRAGFTMDTAAVLDSVWYLRLHPPG